MKTLTFNQVPRRLEEQHLVDFTFSAVQAFFKVHSFQPDTMYVSKRIYEAAERFAKSRLEINSRLGRNAKITFRGLHLVNTGQVVDSYEEAEIELSDIGADINEMLEI